MKPSKIWQRLKNPLLTTFLDNDVYLKSLISLGITSIIAMLLWIGGPQLIINGYAPLAQADKRFYMIVVLFLLWLLKVLILDMDVPNISLYKNPAARKKLEGLEKRFRGALRFMKKATIHRFGNTVKLDQLPWYLLISPSHAGKTVLLANSNVNFILHRQFQTQTIEQIEPSAHCDWWITREASIIDVPVHYFEASESNKSRAEETLNRPALWDYFLRLIKHHRGENGIGGIVIALSLPELLTTSAEEYYSKWLQITFERLHEYEFYFKKEVPCYLLITKCDLMPGFAEYFAESGNDEIAQAWGVMLPKPKNNEEMQQLFITRMNALIKKLNQQLLWRMHQERNPMARPYIKDFPLQVERLKELLQDFIKKFSQEKFSLHLKGVYFTSAMQIDSEEETNVIDEQINTSQRSIQLFKEPKQASRAFFIKQFLSQGLTPPEDNVIPAGRTFAWKEYLAYAFSAVVIGLAMVTLGKDFKQGVRQTYNIQTNLSNYQLSVQEFHNPEENLEKTIALLDKLQTAAEGNNSKINLDRILSFYTHKSKQKAAVVYQQALQTILLPEIVNYLAENMHNPINKVADNIYISLKAYLMLGDIKYQNKETISATVKTLIANKIDAGKQQKLFYHLNLALKINQRSEVIDATLVSAIRQYLFSLQPVQLAYIILQNNTSNELSPIQLGINIGSKPTFISEQNTNSIPRIFTSKAFTTTFNETIANAAQESLYGNWVLGKNEAAITPSQVQELTEKLRNSYVTNYVQAWEKIVDNIRLSTPDDLTQTDDAIANIISQHSPLVKLLDTLHENTYFDPVAATSPKLQSLGMLVDKNHESQKLLFAILSSLQALHKQLQFVINASNSKKAAFDYVSKRMVNPNNPDVITQVRNAADKSPEPIKTWLNDLSNNAWHYLLYNASNYLDLSWQQDVVKPYQSDIINRYPFNANSSKEVQLAAFTHFFGNPGVITNFYNQYLQTLVDTTGADWRWKGNDSIKLPFSNDTLRQIQQAMRIHRSFFPNGDNKLAVQFTLQPYNFAKNIKSVKLNINNTSFTDTKASNRITHVFSWPGQTKSTSLELALVNSKIISREFPGEWGWFKLVSESFETASSRKQMVVNFSLDNDSAKYIVITNGSYNPFMSMTLNRFRLPTKLLTETA